MAKKDPALKVKVVEASNRKLFNRPSEMEKTIEKWVNQGWVLASQQKVRNKDRYTLTFTYRMSDEELAAARRRSRNTAIECFAVIGIFIVAGAIGNAQEAAQRAAAQTVTAQEQGTKVALVNATATQQAIDETATATLWTPTDTPTQTDTPTITLTPSTTFTASITFTPSVTLTITDTPTQPTATPIPPTDAPAQTYYVTSSANARSCPQRDCEILARFSAGAQVLVIGTERGDEVSGSDVWQIIQQPGGRAYIHSSLVSTTAPRPTSQPQQVQQPQQQVISTPVPQPQPQAPSYTCGGDQYNCGDFSSCNEVMSYFNACPGDPSGLDGNNDGVPCESLCR